MWLKALGQATQTYDMPWSHGGTSSVAIVVSELGGVANAETKTELKQRPIAERSLLIDFVYRHGVGSMDGSGDIRILQGLTQLVWADRCGFTR